VSSDSFPSRTRTVIRGGVWFLLLLLMLLASCGKLLGLRDGQVQGACTTDAECAPGYGCLQSLGCHNRCNADSDCGPGSRCFKAFVTTACIPASQGCGQADIDSGAVDACPAGTRCDGSICRTQCTAAADCAGGQLCVKGACVTSDPIHETPLADGSGGTSGHGAGGTSGAGNAAGKHAGGANNGGTDSGGAEDGGGHSAGGSDGGGTTSGGMNSGGTTSGGMNSGGTTSGGMNSGGTTSGGTNSGGTKNGGAGGTAGKGGTSSGGAGAGGRGGASNGGGGATNSAGAPAAGAPAGGAPTVVDGPCDIYAAASTPCVAAYSMVRVLSRNYNGPLYQVRSGSTAKNTGTGGTFTDIGKTADGFANVAAQDAACGATICTVSVLYDQSGKGNHLKVAPKGNIAGAATAAEDDYESSATKGVVSVGGRQLHSLYTAAHEGYRLLKGTGMPLGTAAQGIYMLADGTHFGPACCFDFGNVSTDPTKYAGSNALFFGTAFWGKGDANGPWFMADFQAGIWAGGSKVGDPGWGGISDDHLPNPLDPSLKVPFALGILKTGSGKYAIRAADLQQATDLTTAYDGDAPKLLDDQGGIVLGVGADNSNVSFGTFYEGAITAGRPADTTDAAVLKNIQAVGYGK